MRYGSTNQRFFVAIVGRQPERPPRSCGLVACASGAAERSSRADRSDRPAVQLSAAQLSLARRPVACALDCAGVGAAARRVAAVAALLRGAVRAGQSLYSIPGSADRYMACEFVGGVTMYLG